MKSFFERNQKVGHLLGLLGLAVMIVVSVVLKEKDVQKASGAQNLEATYHVLLTIVALRQNAFSDHWFLPTVTLGQDNDSFVPWGATVPSKSGDYIYTSFTPQGFLIPYIVFNILRLQATVKNLPRFNMAIGAVVGVLLYLLIIKLLFQLGYRNRVVIVAALTGVTVALFSREALLATGIIYWPQALYQLFLLGSLHLFFNVLKEPLYTNCWQVSSKILLLFLFLGAWTEWTGYIFNLGLVFVLWFQNYKPELREFVPKVIFVTASAGIITLLHYGLVAGFHETSHAFLSRFFARSTQRGSVSQLIVGYILSYGLFFLVTLIILVKNYLFGRRFYKKSQIVSLVLLASLLPLIENVIMLQHATVFSFDRLKFMIPSAILIALAFADQRSWLALFVATLIILASIQGFKSHNNDMKRYSEWFAHNKLNVSFVERLKKQVDFKCATFASNLGVRGYTNLLVGRSVYENQTPEQAVIQNEKRGGCASIFLQGRWVFPDLQHYSLAIVTWRDGRKFLFSEGDNK